ncbi:MAG: P1 family peptidase [Solobacterium sp.]|nr:P1 family peptidase [Solobacterium sp.]
MKDYREISVKDIPGIKIGQTEDTEGGTGVTVFIAENPNGMPAGLSVMGGGPASRETELLKPLAAADVIHAVVLGGGSAFGLDAAGGVMKYLEEKGIGVSVGPIHVPLVVQSDIFDLGCGSPLARPNGAMGYQACLNAEKGNYQDGNYGAGCGATVGKAHGMACCMKSGIGSYAVEKNGLYIGAVVSVNALGDVYDQYTGKKLAGMLAEDGRSFASTEDAVIDMAVQKGYAENTTIGIILTNAKLDKRQLCKVAAMSNDGYARSIRPVHTNADGDSIYAVSLGDYEAASDVIGIIAADVMAEAVKRAVINTEGAYGYPAYKDIAVRPVPDMRTMTDAELSAELAKGMDDIRAGRTKPVDDVFDAIEKEFKL